MELFRVGGDVPDTNYLFMGESCSDFGRRWGVKEVYTVGPSLIIWDVSLLFR